MKIISEAVGISIRIVDTIMIEDLKLHKVCAKFVPKKSLRRTETVLCAMLH